MKKKRKVGFVYFLVFTFLVLCVFGGLGFYGSGMELSGAATGDFIDTAGSLSEVMRGVMVLFFEGIIEPVFGYALEGGETTVYFLRALIFLFLTLVINSILSKNDNLKKYSMVLSIIISFAVAAFFPQPILMEGQGLIATIGMLGVLIWGLILLYKWDIPAGFKSLIFFILFLLFMGMNGIIGDLGVFSGTYALASSLALLASLLISLAYFIKAISGGATSLSESKVKIGSPNIEIGKIWPFSKKKKEGNDEGSTDTPPQQPQQASPQEQGPDMNQVKKFIKNGYKQLQTTHVALLSEFSKVTPNINSIKKNLDVIRKVSLSIRVEIEGAGVFEGAYGVIKSQMQGMNTSSDRILKNKSVMSDALQIKAQYNRVIGTALPKLQPVINGL